MKSTTTTPRINVAEVAERRKAGETLAAIGDSYGVSRERIRQILVDEYGTTWATKATRARAGEKEKLLEEWRDQLLDEVESGATLTRKRVVGKSPVPVSGMEEVLGEYTWVAMFPQTSNEEYSEDEIVASLKRVWEKHIKPAPMSRKAYDENRDDTDVSGARVVQRMTWADACDTAGVPSGARRRGTYPSLDADVAVEWVAAFLVSAKGGAMSAREYDLWAKANHGPSMGTVRLAVGSWNEARAKATTLALRWVRKHPGRAYARPAASGVGQHSRADVDQWRKYQDENPDMSIREMSETLGVPASTLRYHLEP